MSPNSAYDSACDPAMQTPTQRWWNRDVHALLGLPFDAVSMDEAIAAIRQSVIQRQRLFLTTPNVNFVMAARRDAAFRLSVLASDMVVADGMPLVWLSRLMGLPIKERVAGADLFEHLLNDTGPRIKVYFFGGPPGAAHAAAQRVQLRAGAMSCVGWQSPGYETAEQLSASQYIDPINASGADFIVVALGALKGQEWIMRNRDRLEAPVLSHLGAVVNFVAGTVTRSPSLLRRTGLEWLWRIVQEPGLWHRYWQDGVGLGRLLLDQLPLLMSHRCHARTSSDAIAVQEFDALTMHPDKVIVKLIPTTPEHQIDLMRCAIRRAILQGGALEVDLRRVSELTPAVSALIMLASCRLAGVTISNIQLLCRSNVRRQALETLQCTMK